MGLPLLVMALALTLSYDLKMSLTLLVAASTSSDTLVAASTPSYMLVAASTPLYTLVVASTAVHALVHAAGGLHALVRWWRLPCHAPYAVHVGAVAAHIRVEPEPAQPAHTAHGPCLYLSRVSLSCWYSFGFLSLSSILGKNQQSCQISHY